jgi:hypothetical protein
VLKICTNINKGEESMKKKEIFSLGLAKELLKLGYKIVEIKDNRKYNKLIFVFEGTEELYKDITHITNKYKKES